MQQKGICLMQQIRKTNWPHMILMLLLVFVLVIPMNTVAAAQGNKNIEQQSNKLSNELIDQFDHEDQVGFMIRFKATAAVEKIAENHAALSGEHTDPKTAELEQRKAVIAALKETSKAAQTDVLTYLEEAAETGEATHIESFHIVNGVYVQATKKVAEEISKFPEVASIQPSGTYEIPEMEPQPESRISAAKVGANIEKIGAPTVWEQGIDGSGIVIATIDSGVKWDHPALKEKYRGYNKETGKVSHTFNWYDATSDGYAEPRDSVGHGTHVTGTMVGSEPDGSNQIGVAPGAKWIAVKAFSGDTASDPALLRAAEWILAPRDADGNERPDLSPDIVNNSWSQTAEYDEWYRDVVKAWVAAGIFPVFAVGNASATHPNGPGTVKNPANYPESFAVGSINKNNALANSSYWGPSPYGEIKPDVVAQGVSVRSANAKGGYKNMSGSSMATPTVAGMVALVKQAAPGLSIDQIRDVITDTALPLTNKTFTQSPNNGFGYGLIQAPKAVEQATAKENSSIQRIAGYLRYDTAIQISQKGWDKADTVILARGDEFADALAGVPLAYQLDAPIILTSSNKLYGPALREIKRLRAKQVIVLGGPKAISDSIVTQLVNEKLSVRRIAGDARFETAAKIANELSPNGSKQVVVANGMDFPDALSVASHAAKVGHPILLVTDHKLTKATKSALSKLGAEQAVVVGGDKVVNNTVMKQLPKPTRLEGSDRFETNIQIMNHYQPKSKHLYVTTGMNFADALTGAVLAAKQDSAILFVHRKIPAVTSKYITDHALERLTLLGGPVAISETVEAGLLDLLKK